MIPEELDPVGSGVESGRQGLGAVPAGHQLLAHHLAVLPPPPRPAARLGAPGAQIFLLVYSYYLLISIKRQI